MAYLRQRPYNKIAYPADVPRDIFISAMDTAPLAADPEYILQGEDDFLQVGIDILAKLTDGKVHLSASANDSSGSQIFKSLKNVELHHFKGPHPAGMSVCKSII